MNYHHSLNLIIIMQLSILCSFKIIHPIMLKSKLNNSLLHMDYLFEFMVIVIIYQIHLILIPYVIYIVYT